MTVAHGFPHCNDIRLNTDALMAPKFVAVSAKSGLHFIGNEDAACFAHQIHGRIKPTWFEFRKTFIKKGGTQND